MLSVPTNRPRVRFLEPVAGPARGLEAYFLVACAFTS